MKLQNSGMCEHLYPLELELKRKGMLETFRGKSWSDNCREWVYFDCILNLETLRLKFHLPDFVRDHIHDDSRSGMEQGFYCDKCKDGIIGHHAQIGKGKINFS